MSSGNERKNLEIRDSYGIRTLIRPMEQIDAFHTPLSVSLFDSKRCREIGTEIHEFENRIFGPDFACTYDCFKPWVESQSLICAAVVGELVRGRLSILSIASILVTDTASRDRMLAGEIYDYQLLPWGSEEGAGQPVLYFSSIISDNPSHLSALYESVAKDFESHAGMRNLAVQSAFCVASGPAGFRHLTRSGFVAVEGRRYMGKYDFLTLEAGMHKSPLWDRLLRESGDPYPSRAMQPPASTELVLPPSTESPRDIEKRLAQSKSQRYLGGKHW